MNSAGPVLSCFFRISEAGSRHALTISVCCVSEAGVLVKTYVERSMLVPDQVMTRLMLPRLEQLSGHSWLLDGMKKSVFVFYCLHFILLMHSVTPALHFFFLSHSNLHPLSRSFEVREYDLHNAESWPVVGTASHPLNLIGHPRCHPPKSHRLIAMFDAGPSGERLFHLCMFRNLPPKVPYVGPPLLK